jgi:hypothetical protein
MLSMIVSASSSAVQPRQSEVDRVGIIPAALFVVARAASASAASRALRLSRPHDRSSSIDFRPQSRS